MQFTTLGKRRLLRWVSCRQKGNLRFELSRERLAQRLDQASALFIAFAIALLFCSFPQMTPRGVQCPTAPVQHIVDTVSVLNCCGKLEIRTVVRQPKEGELGFKQCFCAERKSADAQTALPSTDSKVVPTADLPSALWTQRWKPLWIPRVSIASISDGSGDLDPFAPDPPPPRFA